MTETYRTSDSNPLRIAELPVGSGGGVIGITFAPGKQQPGGASGAHRRDLGADLDVVAAWNAAAVVTLVEPHELDTLGIAALGAEVRRRHMEWHHWPIRDFGVPGAAFMAAWPARSAMLRQLLACGGRVLLHCKGGLGRAGMVGARLLVEHGMPPAAAMAAVRAVRDRAIETEAQERWVAAGGAGSPGPEQGRNAAAGRAVGALLGLAVGDALGATLEFSRKPRFAELQEMVGGGPHGLAPGQWTDDTAMALALADSLLAEPGLDPADLMRRFVAWRDTGAYSCTGTCFDIGIQTSAALDRFLRTGEPLAESADPAASGNGALMRLAPVAIRHWRDEATMLRVAALQTRTTHGSPATIAASRGFAMLLAQAIAGVPLAELLDSAAARGIEGGWRGLHRDAIQGSGWVVRSLQAAVWAASRTTCFRSAVLLAANLGDDADTTAAIAGQLAGAVYGVAGIPPEWLDALAWRERLEEAAQRLFDAGWPAPGELGSTWMTRHWSLRERLEALATYAPRLSGAGLESLDDVPGFHQAIYDYGWVCMFEWSRWRGTAEGERLMEDMAAMGSATVEELEKVLTTCARADRFCEGTLDAAIRDGLFGRVAARAAVLLQQLDERDRDMVALT